MKDSLDEYKLLLKFEAIEYRGHEVKRVMNDQYPFRLIATNKQNSDQRFKTDHYSLDSAILDIKRQIKSAIKNK